jgi:hypothetical protein
METTTNRIHWIKKNKKQNGLFVNQRVEFLTNNRWLTNSGAFNPFCFYFINFIFVMSYVKLIYIQTTMNKVIRTYNDRQISGDKEICDQLAAIIDNELTNAESKIWHSHPVWFLDGNPIVGFSKQKAGIRLMFWSGADFEEEGLSVRGEKFKDASTFYNNVSDIELTDFKRWLSKSRNIQWDYKNVVKRKGKLERLN